MKLFKQLDKLVAKSFVGPYLVSFIVAEFVLILQFIWQFIEDFIGRGVSVFVLAEMIFYYAITIIPLALPISILISSVMVYGNLAEKYELTSFKSAGVSLLRIMRPGILIGLLTAGFSIFTSNTLKPKAYLVFYQTFDNVRRAKPTLTIDQGIFNKDFKGYAIRVGKKSEDGVGIEDVLIYDQTDRRLLGLISAKEGDMYISDDGQFFTMELRNGVQYTEMERRADNGKRDQDQFVRVHFDRFIKNFDMSGFEFSMGQSNLGRKKHDLYNSFQMKRAIDSIDLKMQENISDNRNFYADLVPGRGESEMRDRDVEKQTNRYQEKYLPKDSPPVGKKDNTEDKKAEKIKVQNSKKASEKKDKVDEKKKAADLKKNKIISEGFQKPKAKSRSANRYYKDRVNFRKTEYSIDTLNNLVETLKDNQMRTMLFRSKSSAQTVKERFRNVMTTNKNATYSRNRFELRLHQQLSWATVCVIFLFIGAPLGSIVSKGGFGYPLMIAIVFFVIFIFTNILGEKLMTGGTISAVFGAWLPCFILAPFAIYFTNKAIRDSKFNFNLNIGSWFKS